MNLGWTVAGLEAAGFKRCGSISTLQSNACKGVPTVPGVYVVCRHASGKPVFLATGVGGFPKGNDPSVEIAILEKKWVDGARVLYIGKAGGSTGGGTLLKRVRQYMNFGKGLPAGHWGGRYIWQMADYGDLEILCKATLPKEPSAYEAELIATFRKTHEDRRPFANHLG